MRRAPIRDLIRANLMRSRAIYSGFGKTFYRVSSQIESSFSKVFKLYRVFVSTRDCKTYPTENLLWIPLCPLPFYVQSFSRTFICRRYRRERRNLRTLAEVCERSSTIRFNGAAGSSFQQGQTNVFGRNASGIQCIGRDWKGKFCQLFKKKFTLKYRAFEILFAELGDKSEHEDLSCKLDCKERTIHTLLKRPLLLALYTQFYTGHCSMAF